MKLTDPILKAAKPQEKPYPLSDGEGLVLQVQPNGAKWWRYRYRFAGKAKMLSLGVYPDVTLKAARTERDRLQGLAHRNVDDRELPFATVRSEGLSQFKPRRRQRQICSLWLSQSGVPNVGLAIVEMKKALINQGFIFIAWRRGRPPFISPNTSTTIL